jgi:hypothetical protein
MLKNNDFVRFVNVSLLNKGLKVLAYHTKQPLAFQVGVPSPSQQ